jgi:transposase InsO family protein
VATDYFTKWTEDVPLRNMTHRELLNFVQEHIVHSFGVRQTLTMDQGALFMSHQFKEFPESLKIKLSNSSPYYAQPNGQVEASNRTLIRLIKKKIDDYPRRWHEVSSEALWAHRTWKHGATKVKPFELVYGQDAVLPVEVNMQTCQITKQGALSVKEYSEAMMIKLDEVPEIRFKALRKIEKEKMWVARAHNKRVREKSF